jgi:hypothetical protein
MIGGFICGNGNGRVIIIVRALGPTLEQFNVPNVLADPTRELRDANGALIAANDNWADTQQSAIEASWICSTVRNGISYCCHTARRQHDRHCSRQKQHHRQCAGGSLHA